MQTYKTNTTHEHHINTHENTKEENIVEEGNWIFIGYGYRRRRLLASL